MFLSNFIQVIREWNRIRPVLWKGWGPSGDFLSMYPLSEKIKDLAIWDPGIVKANLCMSESDTWQYQSMHNRAPATLMLSLKNILAANICKLTTWHSVSTLRYCIMCQAQSPVSVEKFSIPVPTRIWTLPATCFVFSFFLCCLVIIFYELQTSVSLEGKK